MATFDYLESRADADELIAEFGASGASATLSKIVQSGEADAPVLTPADSATYAVRVEFTWKQVQSGDVKATDQRWLVAAGPLALLGVTDIQPGDKLNGLPILRCDPLQPAGTVVMFDCWIRV